MTAPKLPTLAEATEWLAAAETTSGAGTVRVEHARLAALAAGYLRLAKTLRTVAAWKIAVEHTAPELGGLMRQFWEIEALLAEMGMRS